MHAKAIILCSSLVTVLLFDALHLYIYFVEEWTYKNHSHSEDWGIMSLRSVKTLISYIDHTIVGSAIEQGDTYFICNWSDGAERSGG